MNSKITLPELVTLLSERTGLSKRQCEGFIKSFFGAISASLVAHENVKVKGLGTFKLTAIDPRKSVNVNTGQEIEIAGHYRVSFVAEKGLAELINRPFEMFETVEISADVTDEMLEQAEAETSVSITQEEPAVPVEAPIYIIEEDIDSEAVAVAELPKEDETPILEEETETSVVEDVPQPEVETASNDSYILEDEPTPPPLPQENVSEPEVTINEAEQPSTVESKQSETVIYAVREDSVSSTDNVLSSSSKSVDKIVSPAEPHNKKEHKIFGRGFIAGIVVCLIVIGLAGTLYYIYNSRSFSFPFAQADEEDTIELLQEEIVSDTIAQAVSPIEEAQRDSVVTADSIKNIAKIEPVEKEETEEAPTKPSDEPKYDTIRKDRFLTTMAKAYYGNYHLWPYIYEANKGLGHPDRIRPGTKIFIPDISTLGIDPKNPADIAKAKRKGTAIYAKYKK